MTKKGKRLDDNAKFRTFWRRFWASWVDCLIFTPVFLLNLWVSRNAGGLPVVVFVVWHIIGGLLWYGYAIWMHARFGQTVGKMLLKVKVVRIKDMGSLTLMQASMRYLVPLLIFTVPMLLRDAVQILRGTSYLLHQGAIPDILTMVLAMAMAPWFFVDSLILLFNRRRRAAHDFIAGTVVVRT
jgi:uncharacterized RDD family membrane protein YckC